MLSVEVPNWYFNNIENDYPEYIIGKDVSEIVDDKTKAMKMAENDAKNNAALFIYSNIFSNT